MNGHKTFLVLTAISFAAWANAANTPADKKTVAPATNFLSTFDIPTTVKDGRDPFFPESTRTLEAAAAATKTQTTEISALKVPGISGTPGHLLAIINNHTFAVGDEGDVSTSAGRVHLRCVDIQPDAVVIEVNGRLHRLTIDSE